MTAAKLAAGAALQPTSTAQRHCGDTLAAALHTLDVVLGAAVDRQARSLGPATLLDPWRGMHLDKQDVERLLAKSPNHNASGADVAVLLSDSARAVPELARMERAHDLCAEDLALLMIALAPEVDLKYERIYGYLQDDLTRRRPTPDLAANLLATNAPQRMRVLERLRDDAPLRRTGLIDLAGVADAPWLARPLTAHPTWLGRLLGRTALEPALAGCASLRSRSEADASVMELPSPAWLRTLGSADDTCPHVLLSGPHGAGKLAFADAISIALDKRLLVVDARDWSAPAEVRDQLGRAARAARFLDAMVYLHGITRLAQRDAQLLRALMQALAQAPVRFVLSTLAPIPAVPSVVLYATRMEISYPCLATRAALWRRALAGYGAAADEPALQRVAGRFAIGPGQIQQAARDACASAIKTLPYDALAAAARAQCGAQLAGLAQRIAPEAGIDSLVVPAEIRAQLQEMCARVTSRETVRRDWGAGSIHTRVTGVSALFAGPSGTGKTLAAEAIARELGFDMYRIDLASIVSKYIGETEQNLDRVFTAAEHANAVLFFDEADALFGKRSEVKDAHDRYANIEVAYLLQKMERFDGLAVLATNLKQNLDEAFARRLTFTVNFPFPEQSDRRRLWEALWPPLAPRADDVDLDWFAREFRLSGGAIRNTVLAAAHLAADEGQAITRAHLLRATRREFQKLGKNIGEQVGLAR